MPVINKDSYPGAYWYKTEDYEQIGTQSGSPLWLIGWSGGKKNSGEPLVTVAGRLNLDKQEIGAAELDALLSQGSMMMSVKLTKDPYLQRENQQAQDFQQQRDPARRRSDRFDRYRSPKRRR